MTVTGLSHKIPDSPDEAVAVMIAQAGKHAPS